MDHPHDADENLIWIARALAEAERGRGAVEPNPLVGAALVRDGRLVGLGHHARFGGPHAEVVAIRNAGEAARGATLYVTLEPCCHHGKTPPCTEAVLAAGIGRVVVAMEDPFPLVAGAGMRRLRDAGLDVVAGVAVDRARRLNRPFLKRVRTGMPYVIAKWAMTLDGKTATASGDSKWISNDRSRSFVHELRGRVDAIAVGIGTAIADDPLLTARPAGPRVATRVVLDSEARLPVESRLVRTAREVPVLVAVTDRADAAKREALASSGCEVLSFPGEPRVPVPALLRTLADRGMTNVLLEGGGELLGAFLDAGQVDEVDAFIAPIVAGGAHAHTPASGLGVGLIADALRLEVANVSQVGDNVRIQGLVRRPWG